MAKKKDTSRPMVPPSKKKTATISRRQSVEYTSREGKSAGLTTGRGRKVQPSVLTDAQKSRVNRPKTSEQRMLSNAALTKYNSIRDRAIARGESKAEATKSAIESVRRNFNMGGTRRQFPTVLFSGPRDMGGNASTRVTGRRTIIRKKK